MTVDEVEALEEARCAAMLAGDLDRMELLFSDEMRWTHASGGVDTKSSMIANFRGGRMAVHALDRSDTAVVVFGSTAVATGTVRVDATAGGVRKEVHSRYQGVWSAHAGTPRLMSWLSARAN